MTAPKRRGAAGFTLIEVMVVVLIIGITVSLVTLSVSSGERPALTEAKRLKTLLSMVGEEAILQGRNFGMRVEPDGYRFYLLSADGWLPLSGDDLLRERALSSGLRLELETEGVRFEFPKEADEADSGERKKDADDGPQLYFLASGEVSPFTLTIESFDGPGYSLRVDETGALEMASTE